MSTMTNTRVLEDSDIEQVLELMRLSLGEPPFLQRTQDLFRWKHIDNPFGRSIALVAEEDGMIVGLRTFMRWNLAAPEGETLSCIRAVDTATHPDYQRRGIFRRLTEEAVELARADGVDLIFNTPNAKSKPGYLKMGWREVGRIGALVRPSLSMLRRHDDGDGFDPGDFLRSPQLVDRLAIADRAPQGLRTIRTAEYLRWRFGSHPSVRYFMSGDGRSSAAILRPNRRNGRKELVVADLLGRPREAARAAVQGRNDSYLATWFSAGSPERSAAARHGFIPLPGVTALTLVMRPLRELPAPYWSIGAWDVAVSDFELL